MTLTFRSEKGAPLSYEEVDANFDYLHKRLSALENTETYPSEIEDIKVENNYLTLKTREKIWGPFKLSSKTNEQKGIWNAETVYTEGDVVQHENALFICQHSHEAQPLFTQDFWQTLYQPQPCVAFCQEKQLPQGTPGQLVIFPNNEGLLNLAFHNGKTWVTLDGATPLTL